MKKIILYIFFTAVIAVSGVIFYLEQTKTPEEPEEYQPLPSEIQVEEKEKKTVTIGDQILKLAPDVNFTEERKKNNNDDIIGRVEIPDLFNVLVVRGKDNSYYLSHSLTKKSDFRGSEFMDYRVGPTSKQINIYGHNSRDPKVKVAFLKLEKFLDKDYFDKNQYIIFQYDGGKSYYRIMALKEVYESNLEHLYVDYTGSQFLQHVKNMTTGDGVIYSRKVSYNQNSDIIVLQTCSHHWTKALYTFIGVKVNT